MQAGVLRRAKARGGGKGLMDAGETGIPERALGTTGGASVGEADQLDRRLEGLDAQLAKISAAVLGTADGVSAGDDNEDRKRLKEKLAKALQRLRL